MDIIQPTENEYIDYVFVVYVQPNGSMRITSYHQ